VDSVADVEHPAVIDAFAVYVASVG